MNKQSIGKLNMFLWGLLKETLIIGIFIELEVIFKSGRKEFKGIAIEEDNKYKFNFKGKSDLYTFNELLKNISKEAENYDGLVFKYVERGTIVVIEGDNKKVNVKYLDNKEEVPKIDEFTASQIKTEIIM